jgi:hypothetical protein
MAKNIVFVSFSQETSWQNGGHRKWQLWGPSLRPNGQKLFFVSFSPEVATWGNLPEAKWPKKL